MFLGGIDRDTIKTSELEAHFTEYLLAMILGFGEEKNVSLAPMLREMTRKFCHGVALWHNT